MKILNTLQERDRYNVVHPIWDTSTHKFSVLYYYTIQQNEGIQPIVTMLHFLFTLSQSLSHNHRDCLQWYNTIHNHIIILSFYRGITMGKYYESPNTMGSQTMANKHPKKFLTGALPPDSRGGQCPLAPPIWCECTVKLGYKHNLTITYLNLVNQDFQPTC